MGAKGKKEDDRETHHVSDCEQIRRHVGSVFLKGLFIPFYVSVIPTCLYVHHMHAVPTDARRGHQLP